MDGLIIVSVKFNSNLSAVQRQYENNVAKTLVAIGQKANEITVMNITASGRVDHGLMRASVGSVQNVPDREVTHGIGVFYGAFQELGTRYIAPGNFIRDNLNNNQQTYRSIVEENLGEGF